MRVDLYGLNANAKLYHVHTNPINSSLAAADSCSVGSVGGHFNPKGVTGTCNPAQPETCEYGDLSGKVGGLAGLSSLVAKEYTVADVPLSGADSIVGRSIVVHDTAGGRWVCASIVMQAEASFSMGSVTGTMVFTQANTTQLMQVHVSLSGLAKQAGQYHVHVAPIPSGVASGQECSQTSVGGHFNPRGVVGTCDSSNPSTCEAGDLSGKHGNFIGLETVSTSYSDSTIVLSGVETIVGRSIVIHKNDSSRWVCANIEWKGPADTPTPTPATALPAAVPSLNPGSSSGGMERAVLSLIAYGAALWLGGEIAHALGCPALVGEIVTGMALGPHAGRLLPAELASAVVTAGQVGLLLMVAEGGLRMDLAVLRSQGLRASVLAITGAIFPVIFGTGVMLWLGHGWIPSVASGVALSSTAIGFALRMMSELHLFETAQGQLIVAAAMLDDVVSLILLAMLQVGTEPLLCPSLPEIPSR